MTRDDAKQMAALDARCYPHPWPADWFLNEYEELTSLILTLKDGGDIIGYVVARSTIDATWIARISVSDKWRRNGLATHLLRLVIEQSATKPVKLYVRESNVVGQKFLRGLGFRCQKTLNNAGKLPTEAMYLFSRASRSTTSSTATRDGSRSSS